MIIQGIIPESGLLVNVNVRNGKVTRVELCREGSPRDHGGADFYLCPGFFDLQVNGFAGVDFNSLDVTSERLHHAARALASTGLTQFLATLISSPQEKMIRQLKIIASAINEDPLFRKMCSGIHLEGPYISSEDGPRGIHPREYIRLPDWEELEGFQEACGGKIRCLTLAPELNGAISFIKKGVDHGMVIGIGHTHATEEVIEEAVQAGASLSVHLGNATPKPLSRHQNLIRNQLELRQLMISIIADGIHLSPEVVREFVTKKGIDGIVLTTDSMAGAGASPGRYSLGDVEVEVGFDGAARQVTTARLAGSTLTMDRAITNVIQFAGIDLSSAIRMSTQNGQKLFREFKREILPGDPANLVLFEYREILKIRSTWIEGEKVF
jgi:N-acetylglucosamine-6-phosphate deacetylase